MHEEFFLERGESAKIVTDPRKWRFLRFSISGYNTDNRVFRVLLVVWFTNWTGEIGKIERLAGSLPRRQDRFVLAWAELHQEELLLNWQMLQQGRPPLKIEPLK